MQVSLEALAHHLLWLINLENDHRPLQIHTAVSANQRSFWSVSLQQEPYPLASLLGPWTLETPKLTRKLKTTKILPSLPSSAHGPPGAYILAWRASRCSGPRSEPWYQFLATAIPRGSKYVTNTYFGAWNIHIYIYIYIYTYAHVHIYIYTHTPIYDLLWLFGSPRIFSPHSIPPRKQNYTNQT